MLARSVKSLKVTGVNVASRSFVSSNVNNGSYSEEQAKKGRPISPHVEIYKFPPAALTSITNRVTGGLLSVGMTGIGVLALAGADVSSIMSNIGDISVVGQTAKLSVAFPLVYHYLAGIRHIAWDRNPELLQTDKVTQSSHVLIGSSVAISVVLALL